MFDKSPDRFPIKRKYIFLTHCGVSPLYSGAFQREREIARQHRDLGAVLFNRYEPLLDDLRASAAALMKTSPENLAFVKNTSEGMSMIACGYPFEEGDQIISYIHEYPANHYPWKLQEKRGAELILLPDRNPTRISLGDRPCAWAFEDLEARVTDRTRIVALSHVQFATGFAADLPHLGAFCKSRGIDLVIDAAQSLGALPVLPEEWNLAAVVSSGWKWLMGPVGTGLMYTSAAFREKIADVMAGAEMMVQGTEYLDHTWAPHGTAKRFEYSTSPVTLAGALEACIREVHLAYGVEAIRDEVFRLVDIILKTLDRDRFTPLEFSDPHRSGILAMACKEDPESLVKALAAKGVISSCRGGLLRFAPHFYLTEAEVRKAVATLNTIVL
ncbi:MAG: aminotransferase class V-fold PLP-dependent enzyme [Planctomycetota bacterium]|jgi:selenocysteine lyase/cysteine desulfurase